MFDHFSWPGGTYICSGILASFHTTVYNCKVLFQLVLPQWQSKHYCIYMLKIWRLILKIIHINKEKSKLLCSSNLHFYLNLLSTRKYLLQFTWWQYLEPKLKFWLWGWSRLIQSLFLLDVIFGKAKSSISHRLTSVLLPFNEREIWVYFVFVVTGNVHEQVESDRFTLWLIKSKYTFLLKWYNLCCGW